MDKKTTSFRLPELQSSTGKNDSEIVFKFQLCFILAAALQYFYILVIILFCVSVRCLQPEGLFKDPTDITRYIHCEKGEPHTMVCPDDMTWDDTRKSCFGQGKYQKGKDQLCFCVVQHDLLSFIYYLKSAIFVLS